MAGPPYIAVVGPSEASADEQRLAEAVGRGLALAGAIVLTGGLDGVMNAASRGAHRAGGMTVGLLPGSDRDAANQWIAIAIATGLGELRNGLVVRAADALIAIGGAYGTLSEVALALKAGVPVIGLSTWALDGIVTAAAPEDAVATALAAASSGAARPGS